MPRYATVKPRAPVAANREAVARHLANLREVIRRRLGSCSQHEIDAAVTEALRDAFTHHRVVDSAVAEAVREAMDGS